MTISKLRLTGLVALSFAAGSAITILGNGPRGVEAKDNRVFELRTYHTKPGGLPPLEARFRDHALRVFERAGMTSIGYWTPQDAPSSGDTFIYILAHQSRDAAKKSWDAFHEDAEWKAVEKNASPRTKRS